MADPQNFGWNQDAPPRAPPTTVLPGSSGSADSEFVISSLGMPVKPPPGSFGQPSQGHGFVPPSGSNFRLPVSNTTFQQNQMQAGPYPPSMPGASTLQSVNQSGPPLPAAGNYNGIPGTEVMPGSSNAPSVEGVPCSNMNQNANQVGTPMSVFPPFSGNHGSMQRPPAPFAALPAGTGLSNVAVSASGQFPPPTQQIQQPQNAFGGPLMNGPTGMPTTSTLPYSLAYSSSSNVPAGPLPAVNVHPPHLSENQLNVMPKPPMGYPAGHPHPMGRQPYAGQGPPPSAQQLSFQQGTTSAPPPNSTSASYLQSSTGGSFSQSSSKELPIPYHGQAQYSHQIGLLSRFPSGLSPNNSGPPSQKSSRAPSPAGNQSYDALEGQFTPSSVPLTSTAAQPSSDTAHRPSGITGKRQYPQMPSLETRSLSGPRQTMPSSSASYGSQPVQPFPPQQPGQPTSLHGQPPPLQQQGTPGGASPLSQPTAQQLPNSYANSMTSMNTCFSTLSAQDHPDVVDLLQQKQLILPEGLETTQPNLHHDYKWINCSPDIFRCTLHSIPQTSSLLNKSHLPLGIIIHPFKDLMGSDQQLPVITSSVIVRCRSCRTYINPFVSFVDRTRWRCNLCYRVNDLPEEFSFDPISKTYGDPQRRPEVRSSTIEFIAPSEYMLRPPQPAVYLFILDVSFNAIGTGYLSIVCQTLLNELDKLPGDARTQIGLIAFDRAVHFFNLAEGLSQPQMLIVSDIEDIFLPCPDDLLVNLHESKDLVVDLLEQLPSMFSGNMETGNALGAALQAAYKLLSHTGGRVTVFQTCLPTAGPGALQMREDNSAKSSKIIPNLGPATDFYKKLALDCSAQQISVDLFFLNGQYADIATVACASKYSGGCLHYYPSFHTLKNLQMTEKFETDFQRYLSRKIGFEAVMRVRCTRGLSIHTFHGNFFVRSTDLLSLPNINPDAGFGMQMSIEDSLTESSTVCFQAALLYTSSKGERRIRVHTLCLPVTSQLSVVHAGADQQAIVALVAKMAVDRSLQTSLADARDAIINAACDAITSFGSNVSNRVGTLSISFSLRLLPLYMLAMLKSVAFRVGTSVRCDDRVFAMEQCKTMPLCYLLQKFYPSLYPIHTLDDKNVTMKGSTKVPQPPLLQLSVANLDRHGAYLLDTGESLIMLVGGAISDQFCQEVFDRQNFQLLEDGLTELPDRDTPMSERLRTFIYHLLDARPNGVTFLILREDSKQRNTFFQHFVEDRTESTMSYYEFLQHLQKQVKG